MGDIPLMGTVWGILRRMAAGLSTLIVGAIIVGPAGNFVTALFDEWGWLQHPSQRMMAMFAWFISLTAKAWFHWVGGLVIGFSIGAWIDTVVRKRIHPSGAAVDAAGTEFVGTSLLLQFFGDHRIPVELTAKNVASWFAYYSPSIGLKWSSSEGVEQNGPTMGPTWAIFVVFETSSLYRQGLVSFSNPELAPPLEIRSYTTKSLVVTAANSIPAGVLEISIQE